MLNGSLRITLGEQNNIDEVKYVINVLENILEWYKNDKVILEMNNTVKTSNIKRWVICKKNAHNTNIIFIV